MQLACYQYDSELNLMVRKIFGSYNHQNYHLLYVLKAN